MNLEIPPGEFAGYIFDCDGTLADSMPLHYNAWCAALKEHQTEFSEALFYELGGVPTQRIVEILNERHGTSLPPAETARTKEAHYLNMIAGLEPIVPVVEFARQFAGKVPIAVASGGHRAIVEKTLGALGILELFDTLVCAEDYTRGKPFPDPFLEAARRLGVAPEKCLVFEDTTTGIEAAKAAGMQWVKVPPQARRSL
jgi:HAD superfamily hydrolase (TIGR01509 family)